MGINDRPMNVHSSYPRRLNLIPIAEVRGDDDEGTQYLLEQYEIAKNYLSKFKWCEKICLSFFSFGVGRIIALFAFEIENSASPDDRFLWVVSGDLPTAYFVTDDIETTHDALTTYIRLMRDWVDAVRSGGDLKKVYPVNVSPTTEWADQLDSRLGFIERNILPETLL